MSRQELSKNVGFFLGQSPTAKIIPVETNPENTHSHKIAHISASRYDKSNL